MGHNRVQKGKGGDLGGTDLRSRYEAREAKLLAEKNQKDIMEAGKDKNFRDRTEIKRMRSRASAFRAQHRR